uniref:S-protein homolog n=1 Tax=Brassica campestris TaxID=3711 RepID=M4CNI6_BRACM
MDQKLRLALRELDQDTSSPISYSGLSNALVKEKNSVHFMNSLGGNNVLKIHCISDEDDLGEHLLKPGEIYEFSFYDSIMGTLINCDLWQGIEFRFHANFRAYEGGGLIGHYGKQNFWFSRDDGIYFTHGKDEPKLEYKWVYSVLDMAPSHY